MKKKNMFRAWCEELANGRVEIGSDIDMEVLQKTLANAGGKIEVSSSPGDIFIDVFVQDDEIDRVLSMNLEYDLIDPQGNIVDIEKTEDFDEMKSTLDQYKYNAGKTTSSSSFKLRIYGYPGDFLYTTESGAQMLVTKNPNEPLRPSVFSGGGGYLGDRVDTSALDTFTELQEQVFVDTRAKLLLDAIKATREGADVEIDWSPEVGEIVVNIDTPAGPEKLTIKINRETGQVELEAYNFHWDPNNPDRPPGWKRMLDLLKELGLKELINKKPGSVNYGKDMMKEFTGPNWTDEHGGHGHDTQAPPPEVTAPPPTTQTQQQQPTQAPPPNIQGRGVVTASFDEVVKSLPSWVTKGIL